MDAINNDIFLIQNNGTWQTRWQSTKFTVQKGEPYITNFYLKYYFSNYFRFQDCFLKFTFPILPMPFFLFMKDKTKFFDFINMQFIINGVPIEKGFAIPNCYWFLKNYLKNNYKNNECWFSTGEAAAYSSVIPPTLNFFQDKQFCQTICTDRTFFIKLSDLNSFFENPNTLINMEIEIQFSFNFDYSIQFSPYNVGRAYWKQSDAPTDFIDFDFDCKLFYKEYFVSQKYTHILNNYLATNTIRFNSLDVYQFAVMPNLVINTLYQGNFAIDSREMDAFCIYPTGGTLFPASGAQDTTVIKERIETRFMEPYSNSYYPAFTTNEFDKLILTIDGVVVINFDKRIVGITFKEYLSISQNNAFKFRKTSGSGQIYQNVPYIFEFDRFFETCSAKKNNKSKKNCKIEFILSAPTDIDPASCTFIFLGLKNNRYVLLNTLLKKIDTN